MSHFGIDLFLREVPPPGYHTNAENRQISKNMTTQAYLTKAEMMEQSMVMYTAPEAPKTTVSVPFIGFDIPNLSHPFFT